MILAMSRKRYILLMSHTNRQLKQVLVYFFKIVIMANIFY